MIILFNGGLRRRRGWPSGAPVPPRRSSTSRAGHAPPPGTTGMLVQLGRSVLS